MKRLLVVFLTLVFYCSIAYAQENPYALETKVIQNQQQLKLLQQQQAQLYLKIESLLVKYGEIKGEIDDIRHRLDSIQNQINQILLRSASVPAPPPKTNPAEATPKQPVSPTPTLTPPAKTQGMAIPTAPTLKKQVATTNPPKLEITKPKKPAIPIDKVEFDKALKLFREGKYDRAIAAFKEFKNKYKNSKYIPDAIFYLAESYYNKGEYDKAIINYDYLVNSYQKSNKVPMATYKEGLSFIKMGDKIDGNYLLQKVIKQYPGTKAAQLAKQYLKKG